MNDGQQLRHYIERQKRSITQIAKDLVVSRQNIYNYYDSVNITPEVKERFESYFGEKIFKPENGDTHPEAKPVKYLTESEMYQSLVRTMENMSEDKIRSTAIIERLVTLIETRFSSYSTEKAPEVPSVSNIPTGDQASGDFELDKRYQKDKKSNH